MWRHALEGVPRDLAIRWWLRWPHDPYALALVPPARIHVEGDRVTVVSPSPTGFPVNPNDDPTIDQMYAWVGDIIEQERQDPNTCVPLSLTFDPVQPVPHTVVHADMTSGLSDAMWT